MKSDLLVAHRSSTQGPRHGPKHSAYRQTQVWGLQSIPSHWDEKPLKHVVAINTEKLGDSTDADFELEYVDIGNVTLTQGITSTERLLFEAAPSRARRIVRDGDTIVSTVRTYLKAVAHISDPPPNLIVSTGFAVLRPSNALCPRYLYRLAQSEAFVQAIVAHSVGVSYPAINPTDIGRLYIPLPPLPEQQVIAAFLDAETTRIDTLVAGLPAGAEGSGLVTQLVNLLQEYRSAIIAAAVVGEIDVRSFGR
jgi:type I restriction enzyme S subunit